MDAISSALRKATAPSLLPPEDDGPGCFGCVLYVVGLIALVIAFVAIYRGGYG